MGNKPEFRSVTREELDELAGEALPERAGDVADQCQRGRPGQRSGRSKRADRPLDRDVRSRCSPATSIR